MGPTALPPLGHSLGWLWPWSDPRHQPSCSPIPLAQPGAEETQGCVLRPRSPPYSGPCVGSPQQQLFCLATLSRPQARATQGELHSGSAGPLQAGALAPTDRNRQESPTALSAASTHQAQEEDMSQHQPWCPGRLGWGGGTEMGTPRDLPGLTPGKRKLAAQARTLQHDATCSPAT